MAPHLVFGAGGIGTTAKSFTFTFDTTEKVDELLSVLEKLNILELDSAGSYPPGNPEHTETLLGQSKAAEKGFIIDSKVAVHRPGPKLDDKGIESSIDRTLELIGAEKVRILYAHAPDRETSLEVTAAAFDKQYREGKFEWASSYLSSSVISRCSTILIWDVARSSNYNVEDLRTYFKICEEKGYVKPAVFQGLYNAIYRGPENELIPLLREHNCKFYAYRYSCSIPPLLRGMSLW